MGEGWQCHPSPGCSLLTALPAAGAPQAGLSCDQSSHSVCTEGHSPVLNTRGGGGRRRGDQRPGRCAGDSQTERPHDEMRGRKFAAELLQGALQASDHTSNLTPLCAITWRRCPSCPSLPMSASVPTVKPPDPACSFCQATINPCLAPRP